MPKTHCQKNLIKKLGLLENYIQKYDIKIF